MEVMIGLYSVGQSQSIQNRQNFGTIVAIRNLHVQGSKTPATPKQLRSATNHLIDVLMKRDKAEKNNPVIAAQNESIRKVYQFLDLDYEEPRKYKQASRDILETPRFIVRSLEDNKITGMNSFLLTGEHALKLERASNDIKNANSIDGSLERSKRIKKAKNNYGEVVRNLLAQTWGKVPSFALVGKREKSGKITPSEIIQIDLGI